MSLTPPDQPGAAAGDPWTARPALPLTPPPGVVWYPPAPTAYPANVSSVGKRFGANLLDLLLTVVRLFIGWMIWDLIVWKDGQTPAKQLLKMRIIDGSTGQPITWGKSCLRNFVCYG